MLTPNPPEPETPKIDFGFTITWIVIYIGSVLIVIFVTIWTYRQVFEPPPVLEIPLNTMRVPGKIAFYYGVPHLVNGSDRPPSMTEIDWAVAVFSDYDIIVFGNDLQLEDCSTAAEGKPCNEDHDETEAIIQRLIRAPHNKQVFGYVPIGKEPKTGLETELTETEINERSTAWARMGVSGIFLDEAGYDFCVPRDRLNNAVHHIHTLGKRAFANAYWPEHLFENDQVGTYSECDAGSQMNPAGHGSDLGAHSQITDLFLLESYQIAGGEYQDPVFWQDRTDRSWYYRNEHIVEVAVVTGDPTPSGINCPDLDWSYCQEQLNYGWWSAMFYEFEYMGWGEVSFSSNDSKLPYRQRPDEAAGYPGPLDYVISTPVLFHNLQSHTRQVYAGNSLRNLVIGTAPVQNGGFERPDFTKTEALNSPLKGSYLLTNEPSLKWRAQFETGAQRGDEASLTLHQLGGSVLDWWAYDGSQFAELYTNGPPSGPIRMSQAIVTVPVPRMLELRYAFAASQAATNSVEVYWGNSLVDQHTVADPAPTANPWQPSWQASGPIVLQATASSTELTFVEVGTATSGTLIDAVRLNTPSAGIENMPPSTPSPACEPQPAGLVHWWSADRISEIGYVGSGGTDRDLVTQGPLRLDRRKFWSARGKVRNGYSFDGSNDILELPDAAMFNDPTADPAGGEGPFTIELWVASLDQQGVIIAQRDDQLQGWTGQYVLSIGGIGQGPGFEKDPGKICFTIDSGGQFETNFCSVDRVDDGQFHHVAVVRDVNGAQQTAHLYIDGQEDQSTANDAVQGNLVELREHAVFVGGDGRDLSLGGVGWHLVGILDEISLYSEALSQTTISQLHQAGSGGKCS